MAINVSQAFHRTSANAVDDTLTLTKAQMLAVNDNLMPSKYLTICQDDGYIYLYDKSATPNSTTGKFTKFEGGGGGTTDYDDLTDKPQIAGVTLSGNKSLSDLGITKSGLGLGSVVNTGDSATPTSGGTTKFTTGGAYTEFAKKQDKLTASTNITIDANNNISATMPTLGIVNRSDLYDTSEIVVGKWTDGRPVYQRVLSSTVPTTSEDGVQATSLLPLGVSVKDYISILGLANIDYAYINVPRSSLPTTSTAAQSNVSHNHIVPTVFLSGYNNSFGTSASRNSIRLANSVMSFNGKPIHIIVKYTKTTDAANSYNYADENDYSTSEKIIGTWINGKTLFQRTIQSTLPNAVTDGEEVEKFVSLGTTVITGVSVDGIYVNPNGDFVPMQVITKTSNDSFGGCRAVIRSNSHSTNPNTLRIMNSRVAWNGYTVYVTIKYTKS